MSDQDLKFLQEEDSICRSMLHLSTATHHHISASVPPKTTSESLYDYTATYSNHTKRHSPSSPSQFQEPVQKRATLHPPSPHSTATATATAADYHLLGLKKIQSPHSFPTVSPPPLRRTISEPIYSLGTVNSSAPPPQLPEFPTCPILNPSWQMSSNRNPFQESIQSPTAASVLQRTISDPNPVVNQQVAGTSSTPPRQPAWRNASGFPSCGGSPSTKRLKTMRERLREMNPWWNQVVSEVEDEDEDKDEDESEPENNNNLKEESEKHMEIPSQEAVWVEKNGEWLVLHFKCPCDNGYQILLSGKNCYYKLTNF